MKILGIMGSPRIKSNTDLLLSEAFKRAQTLGVEVEKIVPDKLNISPCREYLGCLKDGNCVIRDDMDEAYLKILDANALIIATPIYFYGISAQAKAVIDRCQALWARKFILKQDMPNPNKKGALIAVGATKGMKLFDGVILTVKNLFHCIGVEYSEELLIRRVDKRGEIKDHPEALAEAFELGRKLAKQLQNSR